MRSKMACFREQQTQRETAACLGFSGPAIVSRHDFIGAQAERGAQYIVRLITQGCFEEAESLLNASDWRLEQVEGEGLRMSHFDTPSL